MNGLEPPERCLDRFFNLLAGHEIFIVRPRLGVVEVHILDVARVDGSVPRQLGEFDDLVFVDAANHHRVELDRVQPCFKNGLDALPHLFDVPALGRFAEHLRVDGVERDVHAVEPGGQQVRQATFEQARVRRHGHVGNADDLFGVINHFRKFFAQQRLAAGKAHRVHAETGGGFNHVRHVLHRDRAERVAAAQTERVAVKTLVITARRHADAQISDDAAVLVDERFQGKESVA